MGEEMTVNIKASSARPRTPSLARYWLHFYDYELEGSSITAALR
jgi:hypothetical protein